jgi:hypothetical protein
VFAEAQQTSYGCQASRPWNHYWLIGGGHYHDHLCDHVQANPIPRQSEDFGVDFALSFPQ